MQRRAFRPRKRFGQNFLHDPAIAGKIIAAAQLSPDAMVVELGAGKGFLTKPLAAAGVQLVALEVDRDLHRELTSEFAESATDAMDSDTAAPRTEILNVDFTKVSLTALLTERGSESCVLMGNIPYYLTREVLFSFLVDECEVISGAYLMMQHEVGARVAAAPGNKTYGIPSVVLQSLYAVRPLFKVAAGSFKPRPKVDSMVVEFKALGEPLVEPKWLKRFQSVVKNLFQQRRKTVYSTIRSFYGTTDEELKHIHNTTGIDLKNRPEVLSNADFLKLTYALADIKGVG